MGRPPVFDPLLVGPARDEATIAPCAGWVDVITFAVGLRGERSAFFRDL
jgi:hypothetical protein